MRFRFLAAAAGALVPLAIVATSGLAQSSSMTDGLVPGDYLRLGFGVATPLNAQGSIRDWDRGKSFNVAWESWQTGSTSAVAGVGFGLVFDYARLPFKSKQFVGEFQTIEGLRATSATANDAQVFSGSTNIRFRIPSPFIMPSLQIGFGILHYRPSEITYQTASTTGTTKQRNRTGGSISVGGGLDKTIYARTALFGEALYTYAFTTIGQGVATPGGLCTTGNCDALKNTAMGTIRGGLRIRFNGQ